VDERIFCSIEHVDGDGDKVIHHALLTREEASELLKKFVSQGIRAEIHLLNGSAVSLSNADPTSEAKAELGGGDP
jgi:hypothetical protein